MIKKLTLTEFRNSYFGSENVAKSQLLSTSTLAGTAKLKCSSGIKIALNSTHVKLWPTDDDSVLIHRSQTGFYSLSNEIKNF